MAFGLDKRSVEQPTIIDKLTKSYPLSINLVISQLTYIYFSVKMSAFDLFLNLLQEDDIFKTNDQNKSIFIEVFSQFLLNKNTQESYYILENMIEYNLIDSKIIQKKFIPYFVHYKSKEEIINDNENYIFFHHIIENYDELSKNDWELHKKYIKEGHNPNEIAKIIRNDEIEKLQEISTQNNFDFNQKIVPSLYERCDFINQRNVTLINYSAFFGSVKSFKYLLMNGAKLDKTGKYAIAGGNIEIVHLCEQNHSAFEDSYEIAIKFHRNDIFTYIYEKNIEGTKNLEQLGSLCILYNNFEVFSFLIEEGMKINDCIINEAAKMGNMFLVKYFLVKNDISKNMLVYSSESGNIELVRYVLDQKGIDINAKDIYLFYLKLILIT